MKEVLYKELPITIILVLGILFVSDAFGETNENGKVDAIEMETITVTARKTEESAKDVPFSVTVIGGTELENRRLKSFEDALRQTPGLDVWTYGGVGTEVMRIRGVGSLYKIGLDDTSVLINLDGVPQSLGTAAMSTMDIERMEVLKGPQGTLMGRNSEAGAVNIITKMPTPYSEGYVKAEYGTEGTFDTEAVLSGPLTEKLSARFATKYSGYDNQVEHFGTNDPISEPRDLAFRGTLLWEPTDRTDAVFIFGYEDKKDRTESVVLKPYGGSPKLDMDRDSLDGYQDSRRATLNVTHDFDNMIFTSITGYTQTDSTVDRLLYDRIFSRELLGMDIIEGDDVIRKVDADTYYQEFRFSSKPESDIFWVAGLTYYHSDRTLINYYDYITFSSFNGVVDADFETTDYGLFGEITYPLTEKLKLTGGLRYTWDEKEYKSTWVPTTSPVGPASDSKDISSSFMTGRASVSYAFTENVNTYFTYAKGHKARGFQDHPNRFIFNGDNDDLIIDAAKIDSYELGIKMETSDRKAGINVALFFNDITDDHLSYVDLTTLTGRVANSDTQTKGIEFEGFWKIGNGFTLSAGGGYTDTEITSVPRTSLDVRKGNKIPDSPEWNATVSVSHNLPLRSFWGMKSPILFTTVTNRYVGEREGDVANSFQYDDYNQLDFRMGIMGEQIEFYMWGENLLDEIYDLHGYNYGTSINDGRDLIGGGPSRGRILGLGAAYHF